MTVDQGGQLDSGDPLDAPQHFEDATSYQVRDELVDYIRRDLLGPWGGAEEELPPRAMGPRERYLVGMLGPKPNPRATTAPSTVDVDAIAEGHPADSELPEILTPQSLGRMWASSMGLSFSVPSDVDVLVVTAEWGQYRKHPITTDDGRTRSIWKRQPVSYQKEIRLDGEPSFRVPLTVDNPAEPGVHLAVEVRKRDGRRVVEIALVNAQEEPETNVDTAWLFQTRLTVTALDGAAAIFLPIDDPLDASSAVVNDDLEDAHLRLLYRAHLRFAAGRNVAVHAEVRKGERRASKLETTWLPTYDVPATVAPLDDNPRLEGVELSMDALAAADVAQLRAGLAPLAAGYLAWLAEQENKIADLPSHLREVAQSAVRTAQEIGHRIGAGIELLTNPDAPRHAEALAAFQFANRAMALQRQHTEIGRLRDQEGLSYSDAHRQVKKMGAKAASWRPFQLAFILLNLPALTDPAHPERSPDPTKGVVDLLFFPTGGGKTEAYLGLIAYTLAIRRLQGVIGTGEDARSGEAGVAVLMRYTLRLLTAQQFQRAAALICAAEVLRRKDEATWGREPFRIGLWVGSGVSPNWYDDAEKQIADARERGDGERTTVLHILTCPWCGTPLRGHQDLEPNPDTRRIHLWCPNVEGSDACPFSKTQSAEGLPILTVDEEIYRLAPSLVIATVDKLAQLPWRGYAGILFGRVRQRCPRHGYRHDDLDVKTGCTERHHKKGRLEAVISQPVIRLRPPDLIIQDELHLITGALGTVVGLFEAAVDQLCTWRTPDGTETGPKIVASTATTRRAREQVLGVFGRKLAMFPPPVLDVADTFFSRQVPVDSVNPGRRYLGVCAHGVRLKAAEIRLTEILLLAGQTLFDKYGKPADPYMTLVGYFNTTRELAGMRRYLDDDVANRVRTHGRLKDMSNRLVLPSQMLTIQELTSRISSADISEVLKALEVGFDPDLDTTARRRAFAEHIRQLKARSPSKARAASSDPHPRIQQLRAREQNQRVPVDAVLATSMLQVGVDVSRFGLMMVVGQPKNTAEYIQASSRVGRDPRRPGLVVTLYNWTRPRDLAHFEDFEYYHATFYRQVEALSVTPYTRRALDRGTAAMFVAAVRHSTEEHSRNTDAYSVNFSDTRVRWMTDRLLRRAETISGERGRDYLEEKIAAIRDKWEEKRRSRLGRLSYDHATSRTERLINLLERPGSGEWSALTVGQSMRETENDINLLLPSRDEITRVLDGLPSWSFDVPDGSAASEAGDEDLPDGDELGETTLVGRD
ncbi:MAG TPA: DISARM system helicase DrmA [Micromonospora sp.]